LELSALLQLPRIEKPIKRLEANKGIFVIFLYFGDWMFRVFQYHTQQAGLCSGEILAFRLPVTVAKKSL
jgi:hypothetical protein